MSATVRGQASSPRSTGMARPYSDDLRRKILQAYAQGEGTLEQVAERFRVSYGYVKKLRRQQLRHRQMERVPHQPGRKPKFTEPIRERLRGWLKQQPDLTLAEMQVASLSGKRRLFFLPPYSPELNPDEQVWNYLKHHGVAKAGLRSGKELRKYVLKRLRSLQRLPIPTG